MKRFAAILIAFVVGWVIYMIAMVMTVYDGLLSLIFQPFVGALVSGILVVLSLLIGLLLRIPFLRDAWRFKRVVPTAILLCGFTLLIVGKSLGLTEVYTDPETQNSFTGLKGSVAIGTYTAIIFTLANWPLKKRSPHNGMFTGDPKRGSPAANP